ncbi:tripartite tricarboxylate transporter substrate binding protein [Variovorax paradoxus]|uniref:Tripartite tricarboxylate transporter substrate binding protein n=1 Tax=Variovorax paradoxus TaxID=34073 RepID=A0A5Q0M4Q8_VARPD|nr:tripartite tricarboxylate transporter substrate binding protein [Variovorax paradoxus]QFZ84740.1 tripartite tricarboxylate transporter substrate binding protein [Variovorax paradoxus]
MHSIQRRALLCATAAFAVLPLSALAQDYPTRPVTIVVPFSAGGGVDAMARLLAEKLRVSLKQSVVVDNRPGASGMLGAAFVAKAAPDGYTLLLGSAGETAINPLVYKAKMQYSPEKDLAPITAVTRVPNVLVANPSFPAKDLPELVAYAKKNPGKVTYATSGVGNPQHLNGELLQSLAGIQMQHVPYKGASNQLVDVASGNVDITFVSLAGATPFIKGGRVKALAVTSARRAGFAPDIPAIAEFTLTASYDLDNWFGLFAPAKTPPAVQAKLNEAVTAALRDPELIKRLREQGGEPMPLSQAQFRDFIKTESVKYARIVDSARIVAE